MPILPFDNPKSAENSSFTDLMSARMSDFKESANEPSQRAARQPAKSKPIAKTTRPTVTTWFDSIGLVLAFLGIFLGRQFGIPQLDGVASAVIGLLLCAVAVVMAYESKGLLVGEGLDRKSLGELRTLVESDADVESVQHLYTLYQGAHEVLLAIELRFSETLSTIGVRRAVLRLRENIRAKHPDIVRVYFGAESFADGEGVDVEEE